MSKKNSVLKKQFREKDVKRLRNLVQGKYGDRTEQSVGYIKDEEFHEEGDIWEENGRKWTIKDGIKQNITKLDKAKKANITPIFCPNCKQNMKKRFDADYYKLHKKCFDCVIDFEAELKRIGAWEEYHKNIVNSDIDGFIVQFKEYVEEELTKNNNSFITESGDVESWVGGLDKERVLESLGKTIEHLEKMKK
ncbi:hypothetical protein N9981_00745 [bacterium]|nr:hypothetical protein [bacterium]MDB9992647.1 hypothetical protein [bacterium]